MIMRIRKRSPAIQQTTLQNTSRAQPDRSLKQPAVLGLAGKLHLDAAGLGFVHGSLAALVIAALGVVGRRKVHHDPPDRKGHAPKRGWLPSVAETGKVAMESEMRTDTCEYILQRVVGGTAPDHMLPTRAHHGR